VLAFNVFGTIVDWRASLIATAVWVAGLLLTQ
jgi:hypothetical protein